MKANGGSAAYTVTNPATGEVKSVTWRAPALNTVFYRFSEDEVRYIITYGRPGSPMSSWGLEGGGPMNAQQIQTLIEYLKSIQIPREDCSEEEADDPLCESGHLPAEIQEDIDTTARQAVEDGTYASYGEALFNLDLASGAFSCARCHTRGWSFGDPGVPGSGRLRVEPHRRLGEHPLPERGRSARVRLDRVGQRDRLRPASAGHRPHARLRQHAHRRPDPGHRRVRARALGDRRSPPTSWPSAGSRSSAGSLIVIISVALFCGSIYLLLATNLGARLGFLVALTGLAGWMTLLGIIWMIYGIGLKGPDPSWAEVPGRTVLQDTDALYQAEVFEQRVEVPEDATLRRGGRDRRRRVRRRGMGVAERGRPGVRAGRGRGR